MRTLTVFLLALCAIALTACKKKEGCTDSAAVNYDPSAELDCDCCEFESKVTFWYGQPVKDFFDREAGDSIRYIVNNVRVATVPVTAALSPAPFCNGAGATTVKIPLGRSKFATYNYEVRNEFGDLHFVGAVNFSGGGCHIEEIEF